MSDIIQGIRPYLEGPISFSAQKRTRDVALLLLNFGAAIAFVSGFATQSLIVGASAFVGVVVFTLLVVVPPWPRYRGEHLQWLEPKVADILRQ